MRWKRYLRFYWIYLFWPPLCATKWLLLVLNQNFCTQCRIVFPPTRIFPWPWCALLLVLLLNETKAVPEGRKNKYLTIQKRPTEIGKTLTINVQHHHLVIWGRQICVARHAHQSGVQVLPSNVRIGEMIDCRAIRPGLVRLVYHHVVQVPRHVRSGSTWESRKWTKSIKYFY